MLLGIDHGGAHLGGVAHDEEGKLDECAEADDLVRLFGREVRRGAKDAPNAPLGGLLDHADCLLARQMTGVEDYVLVGDELHDLTQRIGQRPLERDGKAGLYIGRVAAFGLGDEAGVMAW